MERTTYHHLLNLIKQRQLLPDAALEAMDEVTGTRTEEPSLREMKYIIQLWVRALKTNGFWEREWDTEEWEELFFQLYLEYHRSMIAA